MKIKELLIEDDFVNKGQKIMVAIAEDGSKWVLSGNPHFPTSLTPYENCWYTKEGHQNIEKANGR